MPKPGKLGTMKEALQIIRSSKGPLGVTVMAPDGTLFFITKAQARRAAFVDRYGAYAAFLRKAKRRGRKTKRDAGCAVLKGWLDANDPNGADGKWRRISLIWGGRC